MTMVICLGAVAGGGGGGGGGGGSRVELTQYRRRVSARCPPTKPRRSKARMPVAVAGATEATRPAASTPARSREGHTHMPSFGLLVPAPARRSGSTTDCGPPARHPRRTARAQHAGSRCGRPAGAQGPGPMDRLLGWRGCASRSPSQSGTTGHALRLRAWCPAQTAAEMKTIAIVIRELQVRRHAQ